jgi:hypothetical protein
MLRLDIDMLQVDTFVVQRSGGVPVPPPTRQPALAPDLTRAPSCATCEATCEFTCQNDFPSCGNNHTCGDVATCVRTCQGLTCVGNRCVHQPGQQQP